MLLLSVSAAGMAQDDSNKAKVNIGADIMSRYVWRGTDFGASPSIQPTFSVSKGAFEIGYWGAYATNSDYTETDLYLKANVGSFSLMISDYFIPSGANDFVDSRYFFFSNKNEINIDPATGSPTDQYTVHALEGAISFNGTDKIPISLLVGTFFYGNDKIAEDTVFVDGAISKINFKNQYSTYVELGYSFSVGENDVDLFLGMTPSASIYSTPLYSGDFAVVNCGISGARNIKITDNFDLPLKASIIANPQASTIFFVFGITL